MAIIDAIACIGELDHSWQAADSSGSLCRWPWALLDQKEIKKDKI